MDAQTGVKLLVFVGSHSAWAHHWNWQAKKYQKFTELDFYSFKAGVLETRKKKEKLQLQAALEKGFCKILLEMTMTD